MVTPSKPRIVAIEENYWDREVAASFGEVDAFRRQSDTVDRLYEYGEARIQEMDEAGIRLSRTVRKEFEVFLVWGDLSLGRVRIQLLRGGVSCILPPTSTAPRHRLVQRRSNMF